MFFIAVFAVTSSVSGQLLESFESAEFPPPGWTKTNLLGGSGWYRLPVGISPLPGWGNGTSSVPPTAGAGSYNAYCTWTTGGGASDGYHNDQWLISPQLFGFTATSRLSFWLRFSFTNYPDTVYVRISTNTANPNDFTFVVQTNFFAKGSWTNQFPPWTNVIVNLGAIGIPPGAPIYVAFQEYEWDNTWNAAAVELDAISSDLTPQAEARVVPSTLNFSVFVGTNDPVLQTLSITNVGSGPLGFSNGVPVYGSGASGWISGLSASTGFLSRLQGQSYTVNVTSAGMDVGTYYATNTFWVPGYSNSPIRVPIVLSVTKRSQNIVFPNPGPQWTTNIVGLTGTTTSGLPLSFSIYSGPGTISGGSNLSFTATGTVQVLAWQLGNEYWDMAPPVTNTITVKKVIAGISLTNLYQFYDSTPRIVTAITAPTGLPVTITYDGNLWAPTNVGLYEVVATVNNAMYEGTSTATLEIVKGDQFIMFPVISEQHRTNRVGLSATASSALPVTFAVVSGPAILTEGTNLSFIANGWVRVVASQAGDMQWNPASDVLREFVVRSGFLWTDFDGDGKSDRAVYQETTGNWYIWSDATTSKLAWAKNWGYSGAMAVPGDYDGDGAADLAVYDRELGNWYVRRLNETVIAFGTNWGYAGAVPVVGDYDGDGACDLSVYDEATGNWYVRTLDGTVLLWGCNWGFPGAKPVPGDYDGDGISDRAVYEERTGNWYVWSDNTASTLAWAQNWGFPGAKPVPGDYDGDGVFDFAVYGKSSGDWYVCSHYADAVLCWGTNWGFNAAVPVPGDFDGDGIHDFAVYEMATGCWYVQSVAGTNPIILFGSSWGGPGLEAVGQVSTGSE